jgi:hypothetical protein
MNVASCITDESPHFLNNFLLKNTSFAMNNGRNGGDTVTFIDLEDSALLDNSSNDGSSESEEPEDINNERKESSSMENPCMRFWILISALLILLISTAVTLSTYRFFLARQQTEYEGDVSIKPMPTPEELNFINISWFLSRYHQFNQFADRISVQVLDQQIKFRNGLHVFATTITSAAVSSGASWPFFTYPLFESIAGTVLVQSDADTISVANLVSDSKHDEWLSYASNEYKSQIVQGHQIKYGNIDNLSSRGYHPFLTKYSEDGFTEDTSRQISFPGKFRDLCINRCNAMINTLRFIFWLHL